MRKTAVIIFLFAFLVTNLGLTAQKKGFEKIKYPELNQFQLPEVHKAQTGNGLQLRLIRSKWLPLVDLEILIRGGSVYDPPAKVGLAGITANLLRIGGTGDLKPDQLDQTLDSEGIDISITSGNDYFSINLSCLRENLDQAVSILARMIRQPGFDGEKLEEIKTRLGSTIARRNDRPGSIKTREFNKLIYGQGSPFAAVLEYEHLDSIARSDVAAFYRRFFAPANMLAGVVGPVEIGEVEEIFEKYFGDWDHRASVPPYPEVKEPKYDFKVAFAEKSNLNQSYISIGHPGVKEDLSEQAKIKVFNLIFSGSFDSRLNTRIRTRMGLTYGIDGGIMTPHFYPGKTYFSTFTRSASTLKAVQAIFDEIDIIRKERVTDKELSDAKDYFINSFVFKYSSPEKILSSEMEREFYGLPRGYAEKLLEEIKTVTLDQVRQVAQQYLHPEKMIVFIVGKEKDLDGKLADLGKVKHVDISIKPPALKEKIPPATPQMLEKGKQVMTSLFMNQYRGYKRLKAMRVVSEASMSIPQGTFSLNMKSVSLYPDKFYNLVSIMGMKIETVINGEKGTVKQMGQERPMAAEQIKDRSFGSFYDMSHSPDKYSFQYLREETINAKTYDVIYVFDGEKNWQKMFINRETGLLEIEEKLSKIPGIGGIARQINSEFKTVSGLPIVYKSETFIKDKKVISYTVKEVEVNPKVDPALFNIEKK
jgi:predicted Zn-dependent peptidase